MRYLARVGVYRYISAQRQMRALSQQRLRKARGKIAVDARPARVTDIDIDTSARICERAYQANERAAACRQNIFGETVGFAYFCPNEYMPWLCDSGACVPQVSLEPYPPPRSARKPLPL